MISASTIRHMLSRPVWRPLIAGACTASLVWAIVDNSRTIQAINASNVSLADRAASPHERSLQYTVVLATAPPQLEELSGGDGVAYRGFAGIELSPKHQRAGRGTTRYRDVRGRTMPQMIPGKPHVVGSLDKEIIRRVVRRHRNEIRHCYEEQLQKNPRLAGTVEVDFVIGEAGSVESAQLASSTLNSGAVEQCIMGKIRRWTFPEPTDGVVTVNYPFKFRA